MRDGLSENFEARPEAPLTKEQIDGKLVELKAKVELLPTSNLFMKRCTDLFRALSVSENDNARLCAVQLAEQLEALDNLTKQITSPTTPEKKMDLRRERQALIAQGGALDTALTNAFKAWKAQTVQSVAY